MRDVLLATWYARRRTALAWLLWPLSWLYRAVVALRRALYRAGLLRATRLAGPVVVVGNVTVGGAGKTPLVIALAQALAAAGRRPGIVSRGYGGRVDGVHEVHADDDPALAGDEPVLLATSGFPVVVGRDRPAAVRALLAAHPACDVVLADDGLQHYALARDVEVAVIDAARGLGNGLMLPAGPLREPASRLAEVDAVVRLVAASGHGRSRDPRNTTMIHLPAGFRAVAGAAGAIDPAAFRGRRVHAVAGIGHPQRFFDLLASLGIAAVPHAFADHHAFTAADLALPDADIVLMTAKDAVKCRAFADARCYALDIRAEIDPALVTLILDRLDGRQAA